MLEFFLVMSSYTFKTRENICKYTALSIAWVDLSSTQNGFAAQCVDVIILQVLTGFAQNVENKLSGLNLYQMKKSKHSKEKKTLKSLKNMQILDRMVK